MPRNAMAPGSGFGPSDWEESLESLTRTGAPDETHLTTHTTSGPLCGAWPAGVRRPRCRDGTGRGEVDGVHRPHLRIPAQMASKRSRGEPDHLADPSRLLGRGPLARVGPGVLLLPVSPAQARVEEGVQAHAQGGRPDRDESVDLVHEQGEEQEAGQDRRPGPQDDDAAPGAVAQAHEAVMDVLLVGGVEPLAPGRPPDEGEGHVD